MRTSPPRGTGLCHSPIQSVGAPSFRRWTSAQIFAIFLFIFILFCTVEVQAANHVQQASNSDITGNSYTSFSATLSSATTSGNAIILGITFGNTNPTITATDTQGNTYSQAIKTYDSGHHQGAAILYATNIAGGPSTSVTVKFSGSVAYLALGIHEYSGIALTSALDVTAGALGSGSSLSSGLAVTTAGGDLIFGVGVEDSNGHGDTFTAGSGFTKRVDLGNAAAYADEDETQTSAGSIAASWTLSPSGSWIAGMAAFKASSSGGGTVPSITSLSPTSGNVGTSVTIAGTNFGATQGTSTVKFNGVTATPTSWGASSIVVPVPAGAGTGAVMVTVGGQASNGVTFTVNKLKPTITWATPAAISYGTALSATQLNATASVPGTFVYTPAAGTVLGVGSQTLSVTFTPTDTTDYTTATQTATLTVNKAAPTITWATPAPVAYGTALSATQLDATANTPGSFVYTPPLGTVLSAESQTLSVTLTPTDTTDYATATQMVTLTVNKATPAVSWPTPAAISYGTALSATQLNATAKVPGTFVYTPAAGTVLGVGSQTLSVTFTPTDSADYTTATQTVTLTVGTATPAISWTTPAAISYGTALSATQLNATANVPGTFVYTPAAGTVLSAGSQTLSVTFTPTDATDYTTATQTVTLTVNQVTATISSVSPTSGPAGTTVTLTGTGFGATQASSTVAFNGVVAAASFWSDTNIVTAVPTGATTGSVVVTVGGAASNAVNFAVGSWTPTLVQHVSQSNTQANAVTAYQIHLPNATQRGNCLIVGVNSGASGAAPSVTDDQGDVFAPIVSGNDGQTNLTIFVALSIAAGAQNITVSFGSATSHVAGLASEFYNVATAGVVDGYQASSGSGISVTAGNLTPVASRDLVYQLAVQDGIGNPISSFVQGASPWSLLSADVMDGMAAQYQIQTSAAAINPGMALAATHSWNSAAVALTSGPSGSNIAGIHVVHLQHNALPANTASLIALQFPSTGNLVVALWMGRVGEDITNIGDGNGNTYAQLGSAFGNGNSGDNQIFYATSASTGTAMAGPVLTTTGTLTAGATAQLFDIAGAASAPFDMKAGWQTASGSQTTSGNVSGASITPSSVSELVISSIGVAGNTINGVSTGNFVASTTTPETSPWPDDENGGWSVGNNLGTNPVTFVWNTTGGPVGNWASIAAGFEAPVIQTTPALTWTTPAAIPYGTALSATQLNATASVPGTFVYTPPLGTALSAGLQTLSVTFTPTDTTDYTTATQTLRLTVNPITPVIIWPTPTAITYGTG